MSYDPSLKARFLALRADGRTYVQIAKILHVSRHTLIVWGKTSKPQLDADRAIDQEDLLDQFQLRQRQRIVILAKLYQRVCKALEKTDLTARGTATLVTLLLRLNATLDKYEVDPAAFPVSIRKSTLEEADEPREKTEPTPPPDEPSQNPAPEPIEKPELTTADSKTEPKLNQNNLSPRTEHYALSTDHFSSPSIQNPKLVLERNEESKIQNPAVPTAT